jgi:hypothetical protein
MSDPMKSERPPISGPKLKQVHRRVHAVIFRNAGVGGCNNRRGDLQVSKYFDRAVRETEKRDRKRFFLGTRGIYLTGSDRVIPEDPRI